MVAMRTIPLFRPEWHFLSAHSRHGTTKSGAWSLEEGVVVGTLTPDP